MKVSKAIELLSEINPDEEIAISWWEADLFSTGTPEEPLSADSDEWLKAIREFDAEGGYDSVNEEVWNNLYQSINEAEGGF